MKITTRVVALTIVGLLSTTVGFAQDKAAAGVQADQRLPEDTLVYLSIPSVTDLKKRLMSSHSWKMLSDPAFQEFKTEVEKAMGGEMSRVAEEMKDNLGVTPMELLNIPSGQVTLGVSAINDNLGIIMFVDFGDSGEVVKGLLEKAAAGMEAEGIDTDTDSYQGTEITSYALPGQEDNPVASSLSYCVRDTEFVLSTSLPLIKSVIDNWDGSDSDTFAANENWAYVKERCASGNKHGAMNWFIDPIGLVDTFGGMSDDFQVAMAIGMMETESVALTELSGMGGVIDIATGKYDAVSKMVYLCEEPTGILKALTLKSDEDLTPPKWVPKSVSGYSAMNWNVSQAYDAIEALIDSTGGDGATAIALDNAASQGPGIHVKDDVLDQMTGKITMLSAVGDGDAPAINPDLPPQMAALLGGKMCMAFGCKDEAEMGKLLTKLTELPGFPGEVREFKDTELVTLPVSPDVSFGLGIVRGNLMLSTDMEMLEQIVRGEGGALSDSPDYKKIASEFPSKLMAVGYTDQREQMRDLYEGLKESDAADMFPGMGEVLENIDFSKLPGFRAVAKYLLPSGSFTVSDERGAFSQTFSLAP